ncbi:unnamed protein product, partial [Iphiclides podalirius]
MPMWQIGLYSRGKADDTRSRLVWDSGGSRCVAHSPRRPRLCLQSRTLPFHLAHFIRPRYLPTASSFLSSNGDGQLSDFDNGLLSVRVCRMFVCRAACQFFMLS